MIREAIGHKCDLAHTCVRRNGRDGRGGEAEEDERAPIGPNLEAIGRGCGRAAHGYVPTRETAMAAFGELTARKPQPWHPRAPPTEGFNARLCSGCARFNCRVREL
jgi:hypothetical protein